MGSMTNIANMVYEPCLQLLQFLGLLYFRTSTEGLLLYTEQLFSNCNYCRVVCNFCECCNSVIYKSLVKFNKVEAHQVAKRVPNTVVNPNKPATLFIPHARVPSGTISRGARTQVAIINPPTAPVPTTPGLFTRGSVIPILSA